MKHVALPAELARRLSAESGLQRAKIFAEAGWWFDALSIITEAIDADPNNASLRQMRAGLLRQVNLQEPAEFETKQSAATPHQSPVSVAGR
jgi:hypothetical protein